MRIQMFHEFSNVFTSQESLYKYLYGGRGIVTLESPSGEKHTYSYEKPLNEEQFPEDVFFVYTIHTDLLDDGSLQYRKFYLGMIENDDFRMTRNSRFGRNTPVMRGAFYIENLRKYQHFLDDSKMKIYHEGVCGLCGSKIWSEKSMECGFGRKCRKEFKLPEFHIPIGF